jgi:hypothetical protein
MATTRTTVPCLQGICWVRRIRQWSEASVARFSDAMAKDLMRMRFICGLTDLLAVGGCLRGPGLPWLPHVPRRRRGIVRATLKRYKVSAYEKKRNVRFWQVFDSRGPSRTQPLGSPLPQRAQTGARPTKSLGPRTNRASIYALATRKRKKPLTTQPKQGMNSLVGGS